AMLTSVHAAAVICDDEVINDIPAGIAILVAKKPQYAFAEIARLLFPNGTRPQPITGETGISPQAFVAPCAEIEDGVIIEAGAIVGKNATIGRGTVVAPNAVVGDSCSIGRDCYIGSQTTVQFTLIGDRVILHPGVQVGQDGFGFLPG